MNAYLEVIRKYTVFSGRATRSEYWMFTLINAIIGAGLFVLSLAIADVLVWLYVIYSLAILVPSFAVTVRRLHDTSKSAWWLLIGLIPFGGIVLLVFMVLPSHPDNVYGPQSV